MHKAPLTFLRWGVVKSLARPTSLCPMRQSIFSLQRDLLVYRIARLFLLAAERKHVRLRARFEQTLSVYKFFPARQGAEGNSRRSERIIKGTCTHVNAVIFPPVLRVDLGDPKQ
jgi:hypothetical protein